MGSFFIKNSDYNDIIACNNSKNKPLKIFTFSAVPTHSQSQPNYVQSGVVFKEY